MYGTPEGFSLCGPLVHVPFEDPHRSVFHCPGHHRGDHVGCDAISGACLRLSTGPGAAMVRCGWLARLSPMAAVPMGVCLCAGCVRARRSDGSRRRPARHSGAVIGSVWRSRWERQVTTYGSARWAGKQDIARAKLLGGDRVFLERWKAIYLRHDGREHVLAFAPTCSGKGVGLVVATLLSWTGSAVVHDIKCENWDLTSEWRAGFGARLRFDPTDAGSPV